MGFEPVKTARIGLAGGMGNGKSTVAGIFRRLGIQIIDADQVARELTRPGFREFDRIVEYFGNKIVDPAGNVDRARLGRIVFSDSQKRSMLESILHPSVKERMHRQIKPSVYCYCILEIPLLIETGQYQDMDRVIIVTCKRKTKTERLFADRGMSIATIDRILATQTDEQTRIQCADDVINNDGTLAELENQALHLHEKYLDLYRGQLRD